MSTLQYSVIIHHPLEEVVTHLAKIEEMLCFGPGGGMRFMSVPSGTYVTVFGAPTDISPDVLSTLIERAMTPPTSQRTAA